VKPVQRKPHPEHPKPGGDNEADDPEDTAKETKETEELGDTANETQESEERKDNWEIDDDLALLKLMKRHNMDFGQVLCSLLNDQHRRVDDTETSLGKRWKNLKSINSRYSKPFRYKAFKPPTQKSLGLKGEQFKQKRAQLEVLHAAGASAAEKMYEECVALVEELREKEVLIKNGDVLEPKMIDDAKKARENIRTNRLLKWEEMAKQDAEFQGSSLSAIQTLSSSLEANQRRSDGLLMLLTRIVVIVEKKAGVVYQEPTAPVPAPVTAFVLDQSLELPELPQLAGLPQLLSSLNSLSSQLEPKDAEMS
jgi:hypothetical protein